MSWMRKRAPAQHRFRLARVGIKQKYLGRVGVAGKPCVRSGRVVLVGLLQLHPARCAWVPAEDSRLALSSTLQAAAVCTRRGKHGDENAPLAWCAVSYRALTLHRNIRISSSGACVILHSVKSRVMTAISSGA